jgi:CRP-like cAMP-binding protein
MEKPNHPLWSNLFRKPQTRTDLVADLWAQTPLFEGIPSKVLRRLAKNMPPRYYDSGESIFKIDDRGAGVALIKSGKVKVFTGDTVLAELGPGDFFGEVALVLDERRTANAIASEATELVYFLRSDLQEWLEQSPRYGSLFAINLSRVLAGRLRNANILISTGE